MTKGTSTAYLSLEERKLRNWWKREQTTALLEHRDPNYKRAYREFLIDIDEIPEHYIRVHNLHRPDGSYGGGSGYRNHNVDNGQGIQNEFRGGVVKRGKTKWERK